MNIRIIISMIVLALLGGFGYLGLKYLTPDNYFTLYPLIPVFFIFLLSGIYFTLLFIKKRKAAIDMKTYTILRTVKFTLCLFLVFLYCAIIGYNSMSFAIVFMVFYMVSLSFESWLFLKIIKS